MEIHSVPCTVAALSEEERIVEIRLESDQEKSILGNIYTGQVENIASNIQAAFVQIEPGKRCYYPLAEAQRAVFSAGRKGNGPLRPGDELLVQVSRDAMKGKLPALTSNLNFTGRYLVLTTGDKKFGLSSKLAQEDRVIVSDIAGTTRDAIDTDIKYNGKEYVFIDTAGLRRKNKIKEEIERYSIIRAVTAVERADVVIIVIDATEGVTEQDAKIAGIAHDRGKGIIIAVNKWDAIEKDNNTVKKHTEKIRQILSFMPYAEILFISAKSGQRLNKIFEMIDVVIENNSMRVATGVLNEIVTEAVAMQQPPTDKGKRLKIYYVTQVAVKPPTFVVFVNDKNLMHFSYTRYLENRIRDTFGFRGTALKFITRERKED